MSEKDLSVGLESFNIPGGFGYTGVPTEGVLMSSDWTIADLLLDESGSTNPYKRGMELCIKEVIKALRACPRHDNLLYRQSHFGTLFRPIHGFKRLSECNPDDYDGCYQPGGRTTLYDSSVRILKEHRDYGEQLAEKNYMVNGIFIAMTDGCDWGSSLEIPDVKREIEAAVSSESLESVMSILIGVNVQGEVKDKLENFAQEASFSQFLDIRNADEKSIIKVAGFISASVSSQSQNLGSGGPSAPLGGPSHSLTF